MVFWFPFLISYSKLLLILLLLFLSTLHLPLTLILITPNIIPMHGVIKLYILEISIIHKFVLLIFQNF